MAFPSHIQLEKIIRHIRSIIFPDYYPDSDVSEAVLQDLLAEQLATVGSHPGTAGQFVASLPEIQRLLLTDVQAALHNDPAVHDAAEVILCYPFLCAMLYHRVAHTLVQLGVRLLPRMLSEMAHSETGIDIHPDATIGEYFCIDHGTGVVIGATAVIGNHVMLYQGVTLGAKHFSYDESGLPLDLPRHPILEDHVTVYSNTSILGHIRIGHDTVIGGNVWLTHDVPPHSRILQQKAVLTPYFADGEGI